MGPASINLDKVSSEIDNILFDIRSNLNGDTSGSAVNIPEQAVDRKEFESVCKYFGCQADNIAGGR